VKRPRELISHPKAHTSRFASFVCIAAQVTQGEAGARFFAAVAFQWGLVADVDIESESMRCLGGLRFTVQAILRIIHLRKCAPAREREREREREGERERERERKRERGREREGGRERGREREGGRERERERERDTARDRERQRQIERS
jgi:hypothetical protein